MLGLPLFDTFAEKVAMVCLNTKPGSAQSCCLPPGGSFARDILMREKASYALIRVAYFLLRSRVERPFEFETYQKVSDDEAAWSCLRVEKFYHDRLGQNIEYERLPTKVTGSRLSDTKTSWGLVFGSKFYEELFCMGKRLLNISPDSAPRENLKLAQEQFLVLLAYRELQRKEDPLRFFCGDPLFRDSHIDGLPEPHQSLMQQLVQDYEHCLGSCEQCKAAAARMYCNIFFNPGRWTGCGRKKV